MGEDVHGRYNQNPRDERNKPQRDFSDRKTGDQGCDQGKERRSAGLGCVLCDRSTEIALADPVKEGFVVPEGFEAEMVRSQ